MNFPLFIVRADVPPFAPVRRVKRDGAGSESGRRVCKNMTAIHMVNRHQGVVMDPEQVREHFQSEAFAYDEGILRLVPHYHEQHGIIVCLIPFAADAPIRALDLGCGTGVLSHVLLSAFPLAHVVAMDLTPATLDRCATTLAAFAERVSLRQGDFGRDKLGEGFDLVVSGLAIHHLDDAGKRDLYRRIFQALAPGGMFLNRELVLGATRAWSERYEAMWQARVGSSGEAEADWFRKYRDEDLPASVEDQTRWLVEIGFVEVACHWRYLNFAIFGGSKPAVPVAKR